MPTTTDSRNRTRGGIFAAQAAIGVILGLLAIYLAGFLSSIGLYGGPPLHVAANVLAGLIAGLAVFAGFRWPAFGLVAGTTVLAAVLLAARGGISAGSAATTDFFGTVATGLQSVLSYAVGAVLLCAALIRRLGRRR